MAKHKSWHESYEKVSELGEGGNGKVYEVKSKKNNHSYALKELTAGGAEKRERFVAEIKIIRENFEILGGIVPIYEYSLDEYWYVMPIATPVINYIIEKKCSISEIIQGTIELCLTLEKLHEKGISHRDIKPSNIYYYEGKFCLGDFGLVELSENLNDFTKSNKGLGAIFTISPEMKRNPKNADGKKADVFSLAKTVWMFLTLDEKGFDGVYSYLDYHHSLRCFDKYKNEHIVEIEEVIKDATNNNPDMRPTIKEFKQRLNKWNDIYTDRDKSQASDWNFLNKQLFGQIVPESSSWRNINKIVEILNIVGKTSAYNHMFFHSGGGLDFSHAEVAAEGDCIKLYDTIGYCYVVKPKNLNFEGFDEQFRWNYFLLELDQLDKILNGGSFIDNEYLVEDKPAHYVSAQYAQYGVYDYETGIPLPEGFKTVYRYNKGKFLIVMKKGPYNGITGTYDGRHGDCSSDEFRRYMDNLIELYFKIDCVIREGDNLQQLSDKDIENKILSFKEFNKNPFKDSFSKKNSKSEIKKKIEDQQKSKEYIRQNFMDWKFSGMIENCDSKKMENTKIALEFIYPLDKEFTLSTLTKNTSNYLCKDGSIKEIDPQLDEKCYYINSIESAINVKEKLEKQVAKILKENNLAEYVNCFSLKAIRHGKPLHLFTKEEIEEVMRNADDRLNNQLVIDENGYAKVISEHRYGHLFPVRHETWMAGNEYVGKYSNLSSLDDDYISSLQGWLSYLKTARNQYMDYVDKSVNEKSILYEIKKYYF